MGRRTVAPGFSGAPVWDVEAEAVCGVIDSINTRDGETSAYMIPVAQLVQAWPELAAFVKSDFTAPSPSKKQDTAKDYPLGHNNETKNMTATTQKTDNPPPTKMEWVSALLNCQNVNVAT